MYFHLKLLYIPTKYSPMLFTTIALFSTKMVNRPWQQLS